MPVYLRKSWRIGPRWLHIRLNASKTGISYTLQLGPLSYNTRARRWRLDLPGGLHYIGDKR